MKGLLFGWLLLLVPIGAVAEKGEGNIPVDPTADECVLELYTYPNEEEDIVDLEIVYEGNIDTDKAYIYVYSDYMGLIMEYEMDIKNGISFEKLYTEDLSRGVYLIEVEVGDKRTSKRMMFSK